MTGLVRKATLLAVCGLLTAGVAMAHVPDPANSEARNLGAEGLGIVCPGSSGNFSIYVVGDNGVAADDVGLFCVTVRDFNNVPIENSSVVIDFSNCDVQLCVNQLDPDVIVDCVSQTVRKLTDVNGVACFKVKGKCRATNGDPLCTLNPPKDCVEIFADGVFLTRGDAPTFDLISQGGEDGMNPNDLSQWLHLSFDCGGSGPNRGNYDCTNQALDPNDLSLFLFVSFGGNSSQNCGGVKDPNLGPKCP